MEVLIKILIKIKEKTKKLILWGRPNGRCGGLFIWKFEMTNRTHSKVQKQNKTKQKFKDDVREVGKSLNC